jgi:hypothetical protein
MKHDVPEWMNMPAYMRYFAVEYRGHSIDDYVWTGDTDEA